MKGRKLKKTERIYFGNGIHTDLRRSNLVIKVVKSPLADKRDCDLRLEIKQGQVSVTLLSGRKVRRLARRIIASRKLGRKLKRSERVIHRNGVYTDVRRSNLVVVSGGECQRTVGPKKGKTSQYKGVCWCKAKGRWRANIKIPNGKYKHLGYFDTEYKAAVAYNEAVRELDLPYAFLNDV